MAQLIAINLISNDKSSSLVPVMLRFKRSKTSEEDAVMEVNAEKKLRTKVTSHHSHTSILWVCMNIKIKSFFVVWRRESWKRYHQKKIQIHWSNFLNYHDRTRYHFYFIGFTIQRKWIWSCSSVWIHTEQRRLELWPLTALVCGSRRVTRRFLHPLCVVLGFPSTPQTHSSGSIQLAATRFLSVYVWRISSPAAASCFPWSWEGLQHISVVVLAADLKALR